MAEVTPEQLAGLDMLHKAIRYIGGQFMISMPRPIAKAHFETRSILWNAQQAILRELGCPITQRELDRRGLRLVKESA